MAYALGASVSYHRQDTDQTVYVPYTHDTRYAGTASEWVAHIPRNVLEELLTEAGFVKREESTDGV